MRVAVKYRNFSYAYIETENSVLIELRNYFTFDVDGAKFNPKFKYGAWDGKIRLLTNDGLLPIGLVDHLKRYCENNDLEISIDEQILPKPELTREQFDEWVNGLEIYSGENIIKPHWYQLDSVFNAINSNRRTLNLPTSAGKSLISALINRWYMENYDGKILVLVPTTALVEQMIDDYADYRLIPKAACLGIKAGTRKDSDALVFVSTWQSACKMDQQWFEQFGMINVDECFHGDTIINTPDGAKKIKDFKPGDRIYSTNEITGEVIEDEVVKLHENLLKSYSEKMYELEFDNGRIVKVTGNHEFMTSNRGWVRADELTDDDDIIEYNPKYMTKTGRVLGKNAIDDGERDRIMNLYPHHQDFPDAYRSFVYGVKYCAYCDNPVKKRVRDYCSSKCQVSHQHITMTDEKKSQWRKNLKNRIPWNKGMTIPPEEHPSRKNPEKWKAANKRLSVARIGENNPMYGKNHTDQYKLDASERVKGRIESGEFTPNTNNRNTHFDVTLNGIKYRSSWEAAFHSVNKHLEFEKCRIRYIDNNENSRIYIVDFVDRINKVLYEVRPSSLYDSNSHKTIGALKWCKNNNYTYIHVDDIMMLDIYKKLNRTEFDSNTLRKLDNAFKKKI